MSQEEKFAPVIDNYHGTEVEDRFRWLENPEDEAVQQWVDEQNIQTESFLEKVEQRGQIKEKLTALWNYEKFTVPQKEGTAFYIHKNDGLQNQARSEEHTSELQSRFDLVCRLLLEKKKTDKHTLRMQ